MLTIILLSPFIFIISRSSLPALETAARVTSLKEQKTPEKVQSVITLETVQQLFDWKMSIVNGLLWEQ